MRRKSFFLLIVTMFALGSMLAACVYQMPSSAAPQVAAEEDVEAVTAALEEVIGQYAASLKADDFAGIIEGCIRGKKLA